MKKYTPKNLHTYTIAFFCAERKFLLNSLMEKTKEKNASFLSTAGVWKSVASLIYYQTLSSWLAHLLKVLIKYWIAADIFKQVNQ